MHHNHVLSFTLPVTLAIHEGLFPMSYCNPIYWGYNMGTWGNGNINKIIYKSSINIIINLEEDLTQAQDMIFTRGRTTQMGISLLSLTMYCRRLVNKYWEWQRMWPKDIQTGPYTYTYMYMYILQPVISH